MSKAFRDILSWPAESKDLADPHNVREIRERTLVTCGMFQIAIAGFVTIKPEYLITSGICLLTASHLAANILIARAERKSKRFTPSNLLPK